MPTRQKRASAKELKELLRRSVWALILPFVIIMAIRIGVCTASECGAMCVFYSLFVGVFIHKELKWEHVFPILKEAAVSTASVLIIMCGANVLSFYMSYERIPHIIAEWLLSLHFSAPVFLLVVCVLFLFLGLFMEGGAAMIILVPLLLSTAQMLEIDLVHFGLLIVYIAQIGSVTPPFGMVIFLISPLLDISIADLSRALIPFIVLLVFVMLLIAYVPPLSTWLPTLVYG